MTKARNAADALRLERSLARLSALGLPIYVGEGGSSKQFVAKLSRLQNLQVCPLPRGSKPTLVNQLRAAFSQALGDDSQVDYVLYTEPDKGTFFAHGLPALLSAAQFHPDGRAPGLILASRGPRAFATFPQGQRVAEQVMNRLCGEALGQTGDYTYGPMLIHRRLLRYTQSMPANLGWGWRFFVMAIARQLRLAVQLCRVASQCPRAQQSEDDEQARDYRLRQLVENVTGLANGWTFLLDQPTEAVPLLYEKPAAVD